MSVPGATTIASLSEQSYPDVAGHAGIGGCPHAARARTQQEHTTSALMSLREIAEARHDLEVLEQLSGWIDQFLVRHHPQLGRQGPVCPFAHGARMRDLIRLSVVHLHSSDPLAEISSIVRDHKENFLRIRRTTAQDWIYVAIMLAFPEVSPDDAPRLIDGTRNMLKPEFVRAGLMLGEFHAHNEQSGLHNADFRPLRSPVPMLAIRHMVPSDVAFLSRVEDSPADRVDFLTSYLTTQPTLSESDRAYAESLLQAAAAECAQAKVNAAS